MARILIALLYAAVGFLLTSDAHAKRLGFVVGINSYDHLPPPAQLQRAISDADDVSEALRRDHFAITALHDTARHQFNSEWQHFLEAVEPGDEVAIFFAGHGVEIEGLNYLLPKDIPAIRFGRQEQLKRESISVPELLLDIRKRSPKVTLVILDACRDHPLVPAELRSTALGRGGLAKIDPPGGTFIMYSAGAGETALDRLPDQDPDQRNSIYTRILLPLLTAPNLTLPELAQRLRRDVNALAASVPHQQTPAYYDGLLLPTPFCLGDCTNPPDLNKDLLAVIKVIDNRQALEAFLGHQIEAIRRAAAERLQELTRHAEAAAAADRRREAEPQRAAAVRIEPQPVPGVREVEAPPVQTAPATMAPAPMAPVPPVLPAAPAAPPRADRGTLVRAIQRELARVGCYRGSVDGEWGAVSKAALDAYAKRTGGPQLGPEPSDEHLRLLALQKGTICKPECGPNETLRGTACVPVEKKASTAIREPSRERDACATYRRCLANMPNAGVQGATSIARNNQVMACGVAPSGC